jgi:hypothetical protein
MSYFIPFFDDSERFRSQTIYIDLKGYIWIPSLAGTMVEISSLLEYPTD